MVEFGVFMTILCVLMGFFDLAVGLWGFALFMFFLAVVNAGLAYISHRNTW